MFNYQINVILRAKSQKSGQRVRKRKTSLIEKYKPKTWKRKREKSSLKIHSNEKIETRNFAQNKFRLNAIICH